MTILHFMSAFFTNGAHWHGYDGIPTRLLEHVQYTLLALAMAAAVGLPTISGDGPAGTG